MIKTFFLAFTALTLGSGPQNPTAADKIVHELERGNVRFASGHPRKPHNNRQRIRDVEQYGQHPKAVVLTCADSRVPPELLFDEGLGDLFTVRIAGNVANTDELASIEYAVEHLHATVIVVLGHTKCGAVTAAVSGGELPGPNLPQLIGSIKESVDLTHSSHPELHGDAFLNQAIIDNVQHTTGQLTKHSPVIEHLVAEKHVVIVGSVYDLHTGRVHWLNH